MFDYKFPFGIHTCGLICYFKQDVCILIFILNIDATVLIVASQVTYISRAFLRRNIGHGIAGDSAWAQTVSSRSRFLAAICGRMAESAVQ